MAKHLGIGVALAILLGGAAPDWAVAETTIVAQLANPRDNKARADFLLQSGIRQYQVSQFREALFSWERALQIYQNIGDRRSEATVLGNLGLVYRILEDPQQAIESHQQALDIARDIGDRQVEAINLGNLGLAHFVLEDDQQAVEFYQEALEIARDIGNRGVEAANLDQLGLVYRKQGNPQQAIEFHQQALDIRRDSGDRQGEVESLGNLGNTHFLLSDYQQALEFHQQALSIARDIGNRRAEATVLGNLGLVYLTLGDPKQTIESHQQAVEIARDVGDRQVEAINLGNLGSAYVSLGDFRQAIEVHQQALGIARDIGDHRVEAASLDNLGLVYRNQGNPQQAIEFHQQALNIRRNIGNRQREVDSLANLGSAYFSQQDYQQAVEYYQSALALAQSVGDIAGQSDVLNNLGALATVQNQPEIAVAFYKESVNIREGIRTNIRSLSYNLQESYTQRIAGTYRRLADLLLDQGRVLEAQQVLELLKIQEIRDYTRNARSGNQPEVQYLLQEENVLAAYGDLITFEKRLSDCERASCNSLSSLRRQRDDLKREYNREVQQLRAILDNRNRDTFFDPKDLSKQAIELVNAQPGTMLIYPFITEDKVWLLLALQGGIVTARQLPEVNAAQLNKEVFELRQLLKTPNSDPEAIQQISQQLHKWLITPIQPELDSGNITNLVFSLDRATRYIPMAILHDGNNYLIEKYAISTIISAELTDSQDRLPGTIPETSILGMGLTRAVGDLTSLDHVASELDGIVKERESDPKGIYPGIQFLDNDFNWDTLTGNLQGRKILHIATHGNFSPIRQEDSYLVLGTGDKLPITDIELLDSYLSETHLVALSACQTGIADNALKLGDGSEINSISYYFLNAGAKAALASLWHVNDASTSELMQAFYANLSETPGLSKAEALRTSQRQFVEKGGEKSHPYYWAPFILIGNGL
ncbi:MAG: tetratricopeptide repeat protein [Cyanobacteria bacterium J06639_1]